MKLVAVLLLLLSGCVSLGSVGKTNLLRPGMSTANVESILGRPKQTEFIENKWVWKYQLHQPWVGFIPYYLVFDKSSKTLEAWYANQEEYYRNQQLWINAMPQQYTVHHSGSVDSNVNVSGTVYLEER